ncbi:MAG: hypothetical protein V4617_10130 [Gemmatimonadota bacterium]
MPRIRLAIAALAALAMPATARAQATNTLAGTWTIEWESGRRLENEVVTPVIAKGTIVISASGDSLIATVTQLSRSDGMPSPPVATFGGKTTAAGAVFTQRQQVRVNINGDQGMREAVMTWTVAADGDVLRGTIAREVPGMQVAMPPTPFTGKRGT